MFVLAVIAKLVLNVWILTSVQYQTSVNMALVRTRSAAMTVIARKALLSRMVNAEVRIFPKTH